jgi:predicted metal-dependent HD superfamily phosphohydrolase
LGPRGQSPDLLTRVATLVRATAHLTDPAGSLDPDTQVLLDADLAILGASEERYRRYAADIRKEYAFVSDAAYLAGRAAVLERFLSRPSLYHHPLMIAEGEDAARRNLRAELNDLRRPADD